MNVFTDDQPLFASLARYIAAMHAFVRDPGHAAHIRLDNAFATLRSTQIRDFPHLTEVMNAAGVTACDLVNALLDPPRLIRIDARLLLVAHDRAISRIDDQLVSLAA